MRKVLKGRGGVVLAENAIIVKIEDISMFGDVKGRGRANKKRALAPTHGAPSIQKIPTNPEHCEHSARHPAHLANVANSQQRATGAKLLSSAALKGLAYRLTAGSRENDHI